MKGLDIDLHDLIHSKAVYVDQQSRILRSQVVMEGSELINRYKILRVVFLPIYTPSTLQYRLQQPPKVIE